MMVDNATHQRRHVAGYFRRNPSWCPKKPPRSELHGADTTAPGPIQGGRRSLLRAAGNRRARIGSLEALSMAVGSLLPSHANSFAQIDGVPSTLSRMSRGKMLSAVSVSLSQQPIRRDGSTRAAPQADCVAVSKEGTPRHPGRMTPDFNRIVARNITGCMMNLPLNTRAAVGPRSWHSVERNKRCSRRTS